MPWTDEDVECARFLRHCGLTDADIAQIIHRPIHQVAARLNNNTFTPLYECARPVLAHVLGEVADDFETIGNA